MPSPGRISIVVADDHKLLQEAVCEMLLAEDDFTVGGVADSGEKVLDVAARAKPDIVLLDLSMPLHKPLETISRLHQLTPRPKVIILTMHDRFDLVRTLIDAGAASYLSKHVSREYLVATIRSIHAGDGVTVSVPNGLSVAGKQNPSVVLSPREPEVLTLVADALSNRQIATRLSITEGTVKRHLRNVFEKLGAASRMEAVHRAKEADLLLTGSPHL